MRTEKEIRDEIERLESANKKLESKHKDLIEMRIKSYYDEKSYERNSIRKWALKWVLETEEN